MTVPRDWAHPEAGPDLEVTVSRVAATNDEAKGVILTNPGGHGGQGTDLPAAIADLEPTLHADYDILGMDPRGTGERGGTGDAAEGFVCQVPKDRLPTGPLDARDRSRHSILEHQKTPRAIAEACQSDAVAPYITTWQTAHDMDLFRALPGESKLNYLGYSYGTWLGAKYASLFPEHTGRFVLDSSVDWQGRLQADFEDFPRMDQRQFDKVYLPWATRVAPEIVGTTVAQAKQTYERARSNYASQGASPDSFDAAFVGNGNPLNWLLGLLVIDAATGDDNNDQATDTPKNLRVDLDAVSKDRFGVPADQLTTKRVIAKSFGARDTDYLAAPGSRYAVACGDQRTRSTGWYKRLSDRQGPRYPLFGWTYRLTEVCGAWSDAPQQQLPKLPRSVQSRVLVVQAEFDPQTSYEQATAAVRKAPNVSVLRIDDAAYHGQYALQANPCVDGVVNTYLLHGSKTKASLCPSIPLIGETKVHPVRGPVDQWTAQHPDTRHQTPDTTTEDGNTALRQQLAERISRINAPAHPRP